jgi:2-oxoglutarate/2-oxoacid ferredoxin oxidoreductase subunit beta
MTFIPKPRVVHPGLPRNKLGLTIRDYEGTMSTLCAGCGHDSVTAGVIQAFHELDTEPHRVVKLSGIGCSSKTPTYFLGTAHGFNSAHGRMPSIATGANAANRGLRYIGISGDGDSLSIGLGQLSHAIRRNLNMLYVIENNGVYGLTKGQFSASADVGTKSKKGEANAYSPIDPALLALSLGATFVARSFSGDKKQLVPLIKAGLRHNGFAIIDVISPCVTFNDHEGSTKSYKYTRDRNVEISHADFVPHAAEIVAEIGKGPGEAGETSVTMHDGSVVHFTHVAEGYDPRSRDKAMAYLMEHQKSGKVPTGLLYVDETALEMHEIAGTIAEPLNQVPFEKLCPGSKALAELQDAFR